MRSRRILRLSLGAALVWAGLGTGAAQAQASEPSIVAAPIDGVVDPFVADNVRRTIDEAGREDAAAVLIEIDTPGGLDSSMREIVKAIASAEVPVVCFVTPQGARAASAGAYVLMACSVSAMAPGTNVGAATPVGISGATLSDKVENDAAAYMRSLAERTGRDPEVAASFVTTARSLSAEQALELGMIDLIAPTRAALLAELDGSRVELGSGQTVTLATAGARVDERGLRGPLAILHSLFDPTLAFIFFWLGLVLIVLELLIPGHVFSGTVGVILLLGSVVSFGLFPVQLIGVLLLAASVVFFLLEIKVPGLGIWSILGIVCLSLGGWTLFDRAGGGGVSLLAIVPVAGMAAVFFGIVAAKVLELRHLPPASDARSVVGKEGVALGTGLAPDGVVRVAAEEWRATSPSGPIPGGAKIRVTALDGLVLTVEPLLNEHTTAVARSVGEGGDP